MLVLVQHIALGGVGVTHRDMCSVGLTGLDWTRLNGKLPFPSLSPKDAKSAEERVLNSF